MLDFQPKVRLVLDRPEGELRLTWVTPRSLGLANGASREVFMVKAREKGVELKCPSGTAEKVAQKMVSGEATPSWAMARVCESPDGDTMLVRRIPGGVIATTDNIGGTFCPASEWWVGLVLTATAA